MAIKQGAGKKKALENFWVVVLQDFWKAFEWHDLAKEEYGPSVAKTAGVKKTLIGTIHEVRVGSPINVA